MRAGVCASRQRQRGGQSCRSDANTVLLPGRRARCSLALVARGLEPGPVISHGRHRAAPCILAPIRVARLLCARQWPLPLEDRRHTRAARTAGRLAGLVRRSARPVARAQHRASEGGNHARCRRIGHRENQARRALPACRWQPHRRPGRTGLGHAFHRQRAAIGRRSHIVEADRPARNERPGWRHARAERDGRIPVRGGCIQPALARIVLLQRESAATRSLPRSRAGPRQRRSARSIPTK